MARFDMGNIEQLDAGAHGGGSDALFELGMKYCSGRDVELNLLMAHKWFNLAALRGNQDAKFYRMEIAAEMSRPDVAKAQRMAREWLSHN